MRKKKIYLMVALMAIGAQGVQAQTAVTLSDGTDNSEWIRNNNGQSCNVTLSGRTLYRDGDWNTLCLPFNMNGSQIANSSLAGATIKELDKETGSYPHVTGLDNGTLYLNFKDVSAITAGTPYIVKWTNNSTPDLIIRSKADWSTFADKVAMAEIKQPYAGIVQLAADISITEMVGGNGHSFAGTFDGGGHTITCDITDTSDQGVAPFYCIEGATIKNLKVTGSVNGGLHCAGLVGFALSGTNDIENCEVEVDVTCNSTNCGGILGHGHSSTTTISNCLFSGKFIVAETTQVGVFQGWSNDGGSHSIAGCVANVKEPIPTGTIDLIWGDGNGGTQNVTSCCTNISSSWNGNGAYYFTTYSAGDILTHLSNNNSNWQVVDDKAVPKMGAIVNPVFPSVTIANTLTDVEFNNNDNEINKCVFRGNYSPVTIGDSNRDEILLLTAGNKLGYAKTNATPTLKAFRAYFQIPVVDGSRAVRSFVLDFGDDDTQGIVDAEANSSFFILHSSFEEGWFTLDGRRLDSKPTKAGLYINNGKKVFIK